MQALRWKRAGILRGSWGWDVLVYSGRKGVIKSMGTGRVSQHYQPSDGCGGPHLATASLPLEPKILGPLCWVAES